MSESLYVLIIFSVLILSPFGAGIYLFIKSLKKKHYGGCLRGIRPNPTPPHHPTAAP